MSGARITRGDTTFEALPPEERRDSPLNDMGCACPWCSPDGTRATPPLGKVWDTRATDKTDACADYRAWRRNGGFAAENGDARVRAVEAYVSRKRNAS